MTRITARRSRHAAVVAAGIVLVTAGVANADRIGPITFEAPYTVGTINGQQGWMKTGTYDVAVAPVASFPAASGYRFGTQALRLSNAVTSGSFGDQAFSPGLARPAGESVHNRHFEASFRIGTTTAAYQPNLRVTVSPDDGQGSRMSFLRFEDQPDGVHVIFADVADPGPIGTTASFNSTDIATLSRERAHRVTFSIDLKPGPANDVVRIHIDGKLRAAPAGTAKRCKTSHHARHRGPKCPVPQPRATGTTWEDYYRYDPEQAGNGNAVPTVSKLLFRLSGAAVPANAGNGVLVDRVTLLSSNVPTKRRHCANAGWTTRTRSDGTAFTSRRACVRYVKRHTSRQH